MHMKMNTREKKYAFILSEFIFTIFTLRIEI